MTLTKKDVKTEQTEKDTKFPKLVIQPLIHKKVFESFHSSIIKNTMVQELNYNVVKNVLESWEGLRRIKNYEQVAGVKLFQKLFESCKEAKPLFGFPIGMNPNSTDMLQSKRFVTHAAHLIQMIDTTVNMLGPDIEMLTEIMLELGAKHVRYGVTPQMFPLMGKCLLETIQECLSSTNFNYTPEMQDSWTEVYMALSNDMIRARKMIK